MSEWGNLTPDPFPRGEGELVVRNGKHWSEYRWVTF
jgi:hypothetical protein